MLKRIAIIGFLAGTGQVLAIFVLRYLSQRFDSSEIRAIAEIDSLLFFIMNLIALGLLSAAMRNIAQMSDWDREYANVQSARITFGLLLMPVAALSFLNDHYLVFIVAPILAGSGDYALYARGYPVFGSAIAFVRMVIPFTTVLIAAPHYPGKLGLVYAASLTIVYIITNSLIAYYLRMPLFYRPSFRNLKLYLSSLPLGIVVICHYFLGLGLVLFVSYLFQTSVVAIAFVGLKFYVIYKGVLRIIHQAFLQEMQTSAVSLKVDQLSMLAGIMLFGSALIFPGSFISFFFGATYLDNRDFFVVLATDALIYSVFLSFSTRAVFRKADKKYTIITVIATIATVVAVIISSLVSKSATGIAIALGIGELIWAVELAKLAGTKEEVRQRLVFLAQLLPVLLIPLSVRIFMGDKPIYFFSAVGVAGILLLLIHFSKFRTLSPKN